MNQKMEKHVCPVWIGYFLANPLRKILQNPDKILRPYIEPGMTVLDAGSAMGFFSLPLAKMVQAQGKVICVDLQPKMLEVLYRRARKRGLADRIKTIVCSEESLKLEAFQDQIDFALAFAVLHEIPAPEKFFAEIKLALKNKGRLLLAEPRGHVRESDFRLSLEWALENEFKIIAQPKIYNSLSALLENTK